MSKRNDNEYRLRVSPLSSLEAGVLKACHEVVVRQQEVLPLLAASLGVPDNQVFYAWMSRRCDPDPGPIGDTGWSHRFHGFECDLRHADGRFLRLDFGPKGRLDTFSAWGVLQFIMTSAPPWSEFPELKHAFAERGPPYNEYTGSMTEICAVWNTLEARGAFEPADPELVAFEAKYTTRGADGITYVALPPDTPEEMQMDCMVAHRRTLSQVGQQLLKSHVARSTA